MGSRRLLLPKASGLGGWLRCILWLGWEEVHVDQPPHQERQQHPWDREAPAGGHNRQTDTDTQIFEGEQASGSALFAPASRATREVHGHTTAHVLSFGPRSSISCSSDARVPSGMLLPLTVRLAPAQTVNRRFVKPSHTLTLTAVQHPPKGSCPRLGRCPTRPEHWSTGWCCLGPASPAAGCLAPV